MRLAGILPPVTTPFDARGGLDLGALAENVNYYNNFGLFGYLALGSNGETVHLSASEKSQVIETVRKAGKAGRPVMAGINELSTAAAIEAVTRAAGSGADAALVITPYFYKGSMSQAILERFFTEVADAAPIPILIYNIPQNTGVVIEPSTIGRLSAHPNLIGVKDSSGNMLAISATVAQSTGEFSVLTGNGGIVYPSLCMLAAGAILAVACAAPGACVSLYEAVQAGDHALARDLQRRLAPVSSALTATYGVAGLKAAMDMAGLRGGYVRAPLEPLCSAETEKVKSVMRESGLFPHIG